MGTAFSTAPASHIAYSNITLTIAGIKLRLGPVFAEGGYSFLHTATPISSKPSAKYTRYAVKRISCQDDESCRQANHEISFLRSLPSHPNIVKFFDATHYDNHAFLLFELVDGGTLPEILSRSKPDANRILDIFADAVAAVTHLHAQQPPIAVRDVKLENLLYDRLSNSFKLCDFGSVTTVAMRPQTRKDILEAEDDIAKNCSAMYRAPELVDLYAKHFICEKVDVWALGCVWYALMFDSLPFDGMSSLQISKGLEQLPSEPMYPDAYITLLNQMLTVHPAQRIDCFVVMETVRRLQGREMDAHLRRIGEELRQRRQLDFSADQVAVLPSSEVKLVSEDLLPALTNGASPSTSLADYASNPPARLHSNSSRSTEAVDSTTSSGKGHVDWADFGAAFGSEPNASAASTAMVRDVVNSDLMSSPLNRPSASNTKNILSESSKKVSSQVARDRHSVPSHLDASSLIDFSDLHISPPTTSDTRTKQRPASSAATSTNAGHRSSGTAKSAAHVNDLIDFGTN